MGAFYRHPDQRDAHARRLYVIQDTRSIHAPPGGLATVAALPRPEPVWLPTYAPWFKPSEKL